MATASWKEENWMVDFFHHWEMFWDKAKKAIELDIMNCHFNHGWTMPFHQVQ
jgi:hypothetical protein